MTNDPLVEASALAHRGAIELRAENLRLTEQVAAFDKTCHVQLAELEMLRADLKATRDEKDFWQRFTIEMVTQINTARGIFDNCLLRAKDAAYQKLNTPTPNGNAAEAMEGDIPQFLQNG